MNLLQVFLEKVNICPNCKCQWNFKLINLDIYSKMQIPLLINANKSLSKLEENLNMIL